MSVLHILIKRNKIWVAGSVIAALISNLSQLFYTYYVGQLVNRIEGRAAISVSFIILLGGFILSNAVTLFLNQYIGRYAAEKMAHSLRVGYARKLLWRSSQQREKCDVATAMSVAQNELAQANSYLGNSFFDIFGMIFTGILVIIFLLFQNVILTLVLLIPTLLILIYVVFSSRSLTIGGKNIKDYYVLIPILINVVNFLSGAISLALSVTTIPNEYERRTSHLIWSRGISQNRYYICLALGNVIVSWISGIILYLTLGVFAIVNGYSNMLGNVLVATLFMFIYTAIICMLTSALSVKLPAVITGVIMILIFLGGALRSILILMSAVITGFAGTVIKRIIYYIFSLIWQDSADRPEILFRVNRLMYM
ncbi:MAG: hypothetical protein K6B68_14000 [Eubacterium sp.]|nr:hypothetical protein [Eubacterium sp.]